MRLNGLFPVLETVFDSLSLICLRDHLFNIRLFEAPSLLCMFLEFCRESSWLNWYFEVNKLNVVELISDWI